MELIKAKPYKTVETGGFKADFYYKEGVLGKTYLDITTVSGVWSMRIAGNTHAYGYLLTAAIKGLTEQIHGYAAMLYIISANMTQDQALTNDIVHAIKKWQKRMDKETERLAKKVSHEQEMADTEFMKEVLEESAKPINEQKRDIKAKIKAIKKNIGEKGKKN